MDPLTFHDTHGTDKDKEIAKLKAELQKKEDEIEELFCEYEQYKDNYDTPPDEVDAMKVKLEKVKQFADDWRDYPGTRYSHNDLRKILEG